MSIMGVRDDLAVCCGRQTAHSTLTAFESWLEADRQHAAGAAPAALYPLFQRAAELLTDRELVALLLGNAAEML